MENKPTDEQVKEVWKWCGLRVSGHGQLSQPRTARDGNIYYYETIDMATPDLNNLFKRAKVKIREKGITKIVFSYFEDSVWCQLFGGFQAQDEIVCGKAETEEDALFWAIWKVIKAQDTTDYSWEAQGLDPSWGVPQ